MATVEPRIVVYKPDGTDVVVDLDAPPIIGWDADGAAVYADGSRSKGDGS